MCRDCYDDYSAAKKRPLRRAFADKEKHPNGIEKRLDKPDEACVERASSTAYAFDKKDVGNTDLENTEECYGEPIHERHRRQSGNSGRSGKGRKQEIAVNNCDDRIETFAFRMPKKHYIKAEKNAGEKCGSVSLIVFETELANEEKAHAGENDHDREEISPVEFLADDKRGEHQYVYRRRVLQKYRVCGRGFLCRPDE